jgi:hypothetical protein
MHSMLYDTLGPEGYASLPTWLLEGLATYVETRPDPAYTLALNEAREATQAQDMTALIPIETLCMPFPEDHQRARLAYAQSASLVTFLRETYGWTRIRALVNAYADGMACSAGAERALDMTIGQLDRAWRIWLEQRSAPAAASSPLRAGFTVLLRDTGPWLMLLGIILLPTLLVIARGRTYVETAQNN